MANTYLQRNTSQAASSSTKATISVWVKLGKVLASNEHMGIFGTHSDSGSYSAGGNSQIGFYNGGLYAWFKDGSTSYMKEQSTRVLRDPNAWYHIVYRFDLTQSSGSDRIKVYVNNEEVTSWTTTSNPPNNVNIQIQKQDRNQRIGAYNFTDGTFVYFDGCMSHFHLCDGQSYAPTEFGETDSTTGEWKIKTDVSVTYGNNGFFVLKDGNSGTDQSPNTNNFTVTGGTLTKTEDCPSNVFATMNPLSKGSNISISNGNTTVSNGSSDNSILGTIAPANGKYYWEAKCTSASTYANLGVTLASIDGTNHSAVDAGRVVYSNNGSVYREGLSGQGNTATGTTFTTNDIIGIAFDTENGTLKFYKNGTLINTTTDNQFLFTNNLYIPCSGLNNSGFSFNFGNGYFGTTAVSSNSGNGYSGTGSLGIFEYQPPTGYTALSTKGLNL